MSYTPTNWQTGDTVTAEKLNKMEQGIETAVDPFIVTLTPTEQDYGGVMDKTASEILAAYQLGKKIVFRFMVGPASYIEVDCTGRKNTGSEFYPFYGLITIDSPTDMLIRVSTPETGDGTSNIYNTTIYPLTPMS